MDDATEFEYEEAYPRGYELEGEGAMNQVEENETTLLFAKLGDELQMLVQRYSVPPTDLEELFQVRRVFPPLFLLPCLLSSLPLS